MKKKIEEQEKFLPHFDRTGLMPAITVDSTNGRVLMMAWVNEVSLQKTLETGYVHYWSRSRKKIWKKGETSGHTQKLVSMKTDCDQDTLLLEVIQNGNACHTDRKTCFYREIDWLEKTDFRSCSLRFVE